MRDFKNDSEICVHRPCVCPGSQRGLNLMCLAYVTLLLRLATLHAQPMFRNVHTLARTHLHACTF